MAVGHDPILLLAFDHRGSFQKKLMGITGAPTAAAVDGFSGFAVGRTIWGNALEGWLADGDAEAASARIAKEYRTLVDAYLGASPG